jgi:DNA-binding NtrC family response regulator
MLQVLLVDAEPGEREALRRELLGAGHRVTVAEGAGDAAVLLATRAFDAIVTDVRLPELDHVHLFRQLRLASSGAAVVLLAEQGEVAEAINAARGGAVECLSKPLGDNDVVRLLGHVERSRSAGGLSVDDGTIVGRTPAMVQLRERIRTMASSDAPVLVTGESGTGKELVARSLHEGSPRHRKPFVAVNCAAFPETLIEAELFGHERGAFTGAVGRRAGRFKAADGGTLFLDEVAELPLPAQAKLLRVLQDHRVEPLGSDTPVHVDVRIVSATHRELKVRIAEGRFRADLYYRLNVLDIAIPPLRERKEDLPLLVAATLRRLLGDEAEPPFITPRAWAALHEHALQHAVVLAKGGVLDVTHLPSDLCEACDERPATEERPVPLADLMRRTERDYILHVLRYAEGRKARAAELLGISRKNLWEKLRAHGIDDVTAR